MCLFVGIKRHNTMDKSSNLPDCYGPKSNINHLYVKG